MQLQNTGDENAVPVADIVADIRRQFAPRRIYILAFHQDTHDHCSTAGLWRHLYLQKRLKEPSELLMDPQHYNVVLHIRRGDVQNSVGDNRRVKPVTYFQTILHRILGLMRNATRPVDVHVFSLGLINLGKALQRDLPGSEVHINSPHGVTFHTFMMADVLVTSEVCLQFTPTHQEICNPESPHQQTSWAISQRAG